MPRRSSGGRSARAAPRRHAPARNPPPQPFYEARRSPSPAPAPTGRGGSMFSGFVQGMALGIGDAVAHRAVDALMGPRRVTIRNEAAAAASPTPAVPARPAAAPVLETRASTSSISGSDACSNHSKAFQDCIDEFVSDINKCQWYMDKLYECKNNSGMLSA
ncbi:coiled-coil-helix-coiled-coil-helix domain-containing protein 10, mitochondrial-like [Pyrus x bretschneideri]|uniref:coiled-coil-helix-coiled-coil-helix domain-containing protein 10, mitochondrial-like n=1 Tax=Pyrus x bretschneideri TaxID=225117 RepID=UPI00202F5802|nr:coiled-coil-helix-coiled-coil-helix domain-containing protein 10, mitochondrial-like [Pyrus x bretschneideri]